MSVAPSLIEEHLLFTQGVKFVAGVDEVGRGALAGPVSVGVAVIDVDVAQPPAQLRDSKQMSAKARLENYLAIKQWTKSCAVGSATAAEIDEIGIINALRLAWTRAYSGLAIKPNHIILDGKHNWLQGKESDLFTIGIPSIDLPVTLKIKADASCASVAAASVLAKVERDEYMQKLALTFPQYGWASNVGYGAAKHMTAIREVGLTEYHRKSWSLSSSAGA
ncbi:MAG: ribonuclease HII [Actinobacteria bacterium]|nr:ribonuclease HII [Actinomycetota bacterium]